MDFSGLCKEVIRHTNSQGLWELSPAGPLFFIFFGQTAISPPFISEGIPQIGGTLMQENITTHIPAFAAPKPIQQSDIEQDFNFFQAQKVAENMLELGLISLSEFNKLSLKNRETFSPFWVEIMPEIR